MTTRPGDHQRTRKGRAGLPPSTSRPTPRQREALRLIYESLRLRGRPPSCRELMLAMGDRSPNGVATKIGDLQRKGLVEVEDGRHRAIRLVGLAGFCLPGLPCFTSDAAGARLACALFGKES